MRNNSPSRDNGMFPFFLHLCMHDEEGVVGEVDRDLASIITIVFVLIVGVNRENLPDAKLPLHA